MKNLFLIVAFAVCFAVSTARGEDNVADTLKTDEAKFSYALGMEIADSLKRIPAKIDAESLLKGLGDKIKGKKLAMTDEDAMKVKQEMFGKMRTAQEAKMKEAGVKNIAEGEKFLKDNAKKDGVVTTASGLQYKILKQGDGPKPKAESTVKVHYRGTLIDGTEFDSSYKRNEPAVFPVNGVIKGWTEALQLMNVGTKAQLFIPSGLAYGERGAGPVIGPNSTLVFEVELISIEK